MKRTKITMLVFVVVLLMSSFLVSSCALMTHEDGSKSIRLTPAAHKTIGDAGKAGVDILGILSMFIPTLAPITAAAGAGVVTWNRMGKKITKYKTPLEHTVTVLEDIKKDKKLWKLVKPYFKGKIANQYSNQPLKPSAKTEATIKELIDNKQGAI